MMEPGATVTVELDVPARMRDGTILRANVYRPAGDEQWPVLLTRLPYGKDLPLGSAILDPVQAARRGYMVIVQDTRGAFRSEGDWHAFRGETEDGADTVKWAAQLPFSNGHVGMYGVSYFGHTQWRAAIEQPTGLDAIAPYITWMDSLDGLSHRGGAFELGVLANWNLRMGLGVLVRRHARDPEALGAAIYAWAQEIDALGTEGYRSLPLRDFAPLRHANLAPSFFDGVEAGLDRTRGLNADTDLVGKLDQVRVPSLNIGGWYDPFLSGTLAGFSSARARRVHTRLLIGPWTHINQGIPVGERHFGYGSQAALMNLQTDLGSFQLRWFDHWLKGIDTGMLEEPPVRIFVMGANVWRDEETWPPPGSVNTPWYLHAGGGLSPQLPGDDEPARYDYDPDDPVPTRGGATLLTPEYPAGPYDQRPIEARPDVLLYASAPLERDTEVTGPVSVHLWARSSAPDTDFVARLVDISPDGCSWNLTDGIIRARFRDAARGEAPSLIEPGRPYEYLIDLWATSNVFKAGHRIGLHVTSSNFPRWDRNPNTGAPFGADAEVRVAHQEILHDREHPSHIVLPIAGR